MNKVYKTQSLNMSIYREVYNKIYLKLHLSSLKSFRLKIERLGNMVEEIFEIRVKKVEELSSKARKEVQDKLDAKTEPFDFRGLAEVTYVKSSPPRVKTVDPIEGSVVDFFKNIIPQLEE